MSRLVSFLAMLAMIIFLNSGDTMACDNPDGCPDPPTSGGGGGGPGPGGPGHGVSHSWQAELNQAAFGQIDIMENGATMNADMEQMGKFHCPGCGTAMQEQTLHQLFEFQGELLHVMMEYNGMQQMGTMPHPPLTGN